MCPQGEGSHFAHCSLPLTLSGMGGLRSPCLGQVGTACPQGLSEGLAEFRGNSTSPCCTGEVLGQGAESSVPGSQPSAFCTGLVTKCGQKPLPSL